MADAGTMFTGVMNDQLSTGATGLVQSWPWVQVGCAGDIWLFCCDNHKVRLHFRSTNRKPGPDL